MNNALLQNPFFSGGLTLMAVAALMALLRNLPTTLWGLLVHWFTISVEIPDRDPAFRWVQSWIVEQEHAKRAREPQPHHDLGRPRSRSHHRDQPGVCLLDVRPGLRGAVRPQPRARNAYHEVPGTAAARAACATRPDERRDDGVPGDVDAQDHRRQPRADRRPAEGSAHDGAAQGSRSEHPDGAARELEHVLLAAAAAAGVDRAGRRPARRAPCRPAGVPRCRGVVHDAGGAASPRLLAARAARQRQDDPGRRRGGRARALGRGPQPEQQGVDRRQPAQPGQRPAAGRGAPDRGHRLRLRGEARGGRGDRGHDERPAQRARRGRLAGRPGPVPDDQSPRAPRPRAGAPGPGRSQASTWATPRPTRRGASSTGSTAEGSRTPRSSTGPTPSPPGSPRAGSAWRRSRNTCSGSGPIPSPPP